jgi:hypothetical protein
MSHYNTPTAATDAYSDTSANMGGFSNVDEGGTGHKSRGGGYDETPTHNLPQEISKNIILEEKFNGFPEIGVKGFRIRG